MSVSTVSKVLNGRTDVAADTRDRLGRMLRSNGYRVASGLPFGVVDLLIGSLHGPWAEELISGAVEAAREAVEMWHALRAAHDADRPIPGT